MTCAFKLVVVSLALIAVGKRCNGHAEDSDSTVNGFLEFWRQNDKVLVLRTTDGIFTPCTWYQRENCDVIGVNVSRSFFQTSWNRMRKDFAGPKYWKFGAKNSTWRLDSDGIEVKFLLYNEGNSSCGVIGTEYYMIRNEEEQAELVKECKEKQDMERCAGGTSTILNSTDGACIPNPKEPWKFMCGDELKEAIEKTCENYSDSQLCKQDPPCIPHPTGPEKYLCRDRTSYDLLLSENEINVPPKCQTFYEDIIDGRPESKNQDIDGCKPKKGEE